MNGDTETLWWTDRDDTDDPIIMPPPTQEWQDAHGWQNGKPPPNDKDHPDDGKQAGRLRVLSVDDLLALPRRDYLVKGWVSPNEISLLVGAKNARKTFLALHIGYSVAQGSHIFGRRVKQTAVLYLIAEGEAGIGKRVKGLVSRHGKCDAFHVIAQPIDLLRSSASTGDLHDVIEAAKMHQVGLIVVDTISRAMMGGDENGPTDMGTLTANLNILRHETGAHIMGVHHGTQKDGTKSRGHSSLPFSVDAIAQVEWAEEHDAGTVIIGFCRDDAIGALGTFQTEVVELGEDEDGDKVSTLLITETNPKPPPAKSSERKMTDKQFSLLELVTDLMARSGGPIQPMLGMPTVTGMPRHSLRAGLITRGWFDEGQLLNGEQLTKAGHTAENNGLTALKNRRYLSFDRKYVWLV